MKRLRRLFLLALILAGCCIPFEAFAVPKEIIPIHWADIMSRMNWQTDSCAYSVGKGEQKVSISRVGNHTTITGGHICEIRMSRKDLWYEEDQSLYGWHTEPGTYTFSDVVLHGQNTLLEVWANDDDKFRVILEKGVKGAHVLNGFVCAGPSIHVSAIPEYYQTMKQLGYKFEEIEGGFGIDAHALKESSIEIVNNTLIDTDIWDRPLSVYLDPQASFTLSGTGNVRISPEKTRDLELSRKSHMVLCLCGRADKDQEAVGQFVDILKDRVQIDESQFIGADGRPQIYIVYDRIGSDDPYLSIEMDFERTDVHSALSGNANQLQLRTQDRQASILENQVYPLGSGETLFYARLLDKNREAWRLQEQAQLYIPYPTGINAANAQLYLFSVDYPNPTGKSPLQYSTKEGTITPTEYGLMMNVDDIYPFKLCWERNAEMSGIHNEADAEKLLPVETPVLILPDGVQLDMSARLVYDKPDAEHHGRIVYNVRLIKDEGQEVELPSEAILCFPYPEGLDQSSARKYSILIHHYGKNGTEVFKTEDGSIELTGHGLCIQVNSLSPFVITWEEKEDTIALPQTGDNSNVVLWLLLMLLSGTVILLNKGRQAEKEH